MTTLQKVPRVILLSFLISFFFISLRAQDSIETQKFIYFPYPSQHKWTTSIGFTGTTMPYEITEELHYRIPAGDFQAVRRFTKHFSLDARLSFQFIQNLITLGPRYTARISDRTSFSVGDDAGYWFGFLTLQGFKTRGSGTINQPNLSLGYLFNNKVLLTIKADAVLVSGIRTYAGNIPVTTHYNLLSGSAYTIALEQPFFGKKSLILGFRALYTSFFWQTWVAFTSFDRNLFYPQLIVNIIL